TYDRKEDYRGRKWAEQCLDFATYEKRDWLYEKGVRIIPVVGGAERGGYIAEGHGNSVSRVHITRGIGSGVVEPVMKRMKQLEEKGFITYKPRHRVNEILTDGTDVIGVSGDVLAESDLKRGEKSNRKVVDDFVQNAEATVICSGGIGANFE